MNPEQQRIAIAEACGWTECQLIKGYDGKLVPYGFAPNESPILKETPDYLSDLNAMHHAENYCLHNLLLWAKYRHLLLLITSNVSGVPESATAAQRAEAFLKTLGLWEK